MPRLLLIFFVLLSTLATPVHAQSMAASIAICLSGQAVCNKACGNGSTAMQCINSCTMKSQTCMNNKGQWPDAETDDANELPASSSRRRQQNIIDGADELPPTSSRRQTATQPDEYEEETTNRSRSGSSRGCTADTEFVHAWPVDTRKDEFKFKFRVTSTDCQAYGCSGYVRHRIHFNWKGVGGGGKSTLFKYYIPKGQRSTEVTQSTFPGGVGLAVDVRDVEIRETSCTSP